MNEYAAAAVLALLAVALLLLMRRGWLRQRDAHADDVAAPPAVPDDAALGAPLSAPVEAVYVSTTRAADAFDRVVAHGLGARSAAVARVHEHGLVVRRTGAADLFVPAADVTAVGTAPGMAGKVVGGEGLVVVEWRLGDARVRSGLRTRRRADRPVLLEALGGLVPTGTTERPTDRPTDRPVTPRTEDKP